MTTNARVQPQSTSRPARAVDPQSSLSAVVTRPAVTIAADATLAEAVALMQEESVSALLVRADEGVVTERDLARALGAGGASTDPVGAVMTSHPVSVPGSTTVIAAAGIMLNEQLRHLLVDLGGGALGVVSIRDLLAVMLQASDPHEWLTSLRVAIEEPPENYLG